MFTPTRLSLFAMALGLWLLAGCAATPQALFEQGLDADIGAGKATGFTPSSGYSSQREAAIEDYEAACTAGEEAACFFFERLMLARRPDLKTFRREQDKFKARCETGDGRACFRWGRLFDDQGGLGLEPVRAMQLYRKACDLDYEFACQKTAAMHYFILWSRISNIETRKLTTRSCHAGYGRACVVAADLAKMGRGGPRNRPLSRELLERACRRGQTTACTRLATWWRYRGDKGKAKAILEGLYRPMARACRRGHPAACGLAAFLWETPELGDAASEPADRDDLRAVMLDACIGGELRQACSAAMASQAWIVGPEDSRDEVRQLVGRRLKALSAAPSGEQHPPREKLQAWRGYYQERCFQGASPFACSSLARLERGIGNRAEAQKASAEAKRLGDAHYDRSLKRRLVGCAKDDAFDCYQVARLLKMRSGRADRIRKFRAKARRLEAKLRATYGPNVNE